MDRGRGAVVAMPGPPVRGHASRAREMVRLSGLAEAPAVPGAAVGPREAGPAGRSAGHGAAWARVGRAAGSALCPCGSHPSRPGPPQSRWSEYATAST